MNQSHLGERTRSCTLPDIGERAQTGYQTRGYPLLLRNY